VYSLFDDGSADVTSRRTLTACIQLVAYTNCAVNPLIYSLLNERFKARLNKLAATVKLWGPRSGRRHDGHLASGRGRVAVVAGSPLRLGLMVTREAPMTPDVPANSAAQLANITGQGHALQNGSSCPSLGKY